MPNLTKKHLDRYFFERSQADCSKIIQFGNRPTRKITEPFCLFILSTLEAKGNSPNLIHLRSIQKDVTINSHVDRRMQKR